MMEYLIFFNRINDLPEVFTIMATTNEVDANTLLQEQQQAPVLKTTVNKNPFQALWESLGAEKGWDPAQTRAVLEGSGRYRIVRKTTAKWHNMTRAIDTLSSLSDWTDDNMLNRPGILVERVTDEQLAPLALEFLSDLAYGVSMYTIAKMFILAWNLRSPGEFEPIFPPSDPTQCPNDTNPFELPTTYERTFNYTHGDVGFTSDDIKHQVAGSYYLAASLLRLMTKDPDSYARAFPSIVKTYENFYHHEFPISLVIEAPVLEYIRSKLSQFSYFRNSLTGFLFCHDLYKEHRNIRRYLFEQHLSNTGMHAYNLFVRIMLKRYCSIEAFFNIIYHPSYEDTLTELATIVDNYKHHTEMCPLNTWRYARIFDDKYFAHVQTKNCVNLVFILAAIASEIGAQQDNAGDLTKIRQFQNISKSDQFIFLKVAVRAANVIRTYPTKATASNMWTEDLTTEIVNDNEVLEDTLRAEVVTAAVPPNRQQTVMEVTTNQDLLGLLDDTNEENEAGDEYDEVDEDFVPQGAYLDLLD